MRLTLRRGEQAQSAEEMYPYLGLNIVDLVVNRSKLLLQLLQQLVTRVGWESRCIQF
jgi:hypothetical protein